MIQCRDCGETKPSSEYYHRKDSGKYRTDCKECIRSKRSKYRKDNPEVVNATNRRAYAKKPDQYRKARERRDSAKWISRSSACNSRAKKLGVDGWISYMQVKLLFESHGHMCYYCDKILDVSTREACVEHMTPISRGGLNVIQNCIPSCRSCNARKGEMTVLEFTGEN